MATCSICKFWPKVECVHNPSRTYCLYVRKTMGRYLGEQTKRSTMYYLNKYGKCPYYKKKWWRRNK